MSIRRIWPTNSFTSLQELFDFVREQRGLDKEYYEKVEAEHLEDLNYLGGLVQANQDIAATRKIEIDSLVEEIEAVEETLEITLAERDEAREQRDAFHELAAKRTDEYAKMMIERDSARAERDSALAKRDEWAYRAIDAAKERDEARKQPALDPAEFAATVNPTLKRPVTKYDLTTDQRISRLEAKVANLELGGYR